MDEKSVFGPQMRRSLAVALILCLAAAPAFAQMTEYEQGQLQGELDASGQPVWILSGLLLGPIGLILPWIISPRVPGAMLIGKSAEYVAGYMEGYRREARPKNFLYSLAGFAVWGVAATVLLVGAARASAQTASSCGDAIGDNCSEACSSAFSDWLSNACSSSCSPSPDPL